MSEHAKALFAYAGKLPHAERLHSTEGSVRGRLLTVTRNLVVDRMRSASARHETVGADDRDVPLPDHADAVLTSVEATSMLRQLSRDHREVLLHTYLCGRTTAELDVWPPALACGAEVEAITFADKCGLLLPEYPVGVPAGHHPLHVRVTAVLLLRGLDRGSGECLQVTLKA